MIRTDNGVIELKPQLENHFSCPECHARQPIIKEVFIQPVCVFADCLCRKCDLAFYQTLHVGHTITENFSISKSEKKIYSDGNQTWLAKILDQAHSLAEEEVAIERKIFKHFKNVVILNTLDYLYGHVLLKLYNAEYHLTHQKNLGLIIIIPKIFEWLIPAGCAEAWIVDLKLSEFAHGHQSIQSFISKQFERFDKVYLSKAYSHPDFTKIDIAKLTGIKPFNLHYFEDLKPTITIVLREDRWWFGSHVDYWFYRFCRKFKLLSKGGRILSLRQNSLVKKTIGLIQKRIPNADFLIVGLGKTGSFKGIGSDYREPTINPAIESEWCRLYSRSHVVIGIHGSNMLLPTALAAGCVEILPNDRYPNMVQDISVRYNDRRQLFFYRFVDQYASPASVAEKAVAIIRDYHEFNNNMFLKQNTPERKKHHHGS